MYVTWDLRKTSKEIREQQLKDREESKGEFHRNIKYLSWEDDGYLNCASKGPSITYATKE